MSTNSESETPKERRVIYICCAVLVVAALVLGMVFFNYAKDNREARDKADQLIAAIDQAGGPTPSQDQIVNALGTDGGAVCDNPNDRLSRAILFSQMVNGAGGPGSRPVIVDSRVVEGQRLIMRIYCPDELTDFQKWVSDLKFGDVING